MNINKQEKHYCERITQIGIWNVIGTTIWPANGPIVKCDDCGMEFNLTWENWEYVPRENKKVNIQNTV